MNGYLKTLKITETPEQNHPKSDTVNTGGLAKCTSILQKLQYLLAITGAMSTYCFLMFLALTSLIEQYTVNPITTARYATALHTAMMIVLAMEKLSSSRRRIVE